MKASIPTDLDALSREFAALALSAGKIIMEIYCSAFAVKAKGDGSPVTDADAKAERAVVDGLKRLLPGVQIVAEEACAHRLETRVDRDFLLVDALDGTAEFVARRPEFTVNIALISDHRPVAGCVYSPASGELYVGGKTASFGRSVKGSDALPVLEPIGARERPSPCIAAVSRSHLDEATKHFLEDQSISETLSVGSSIKFCRIAEGLCDVYPRFGRTMEWDTAAGHAVLRAAGGEVMTTDGAPLRYGKVAQGFANSPFIARGR